MKVQVTAQDIKDGWPWSFARIVAGPKPFQIDSRHKYCPVAVALKRAFKTKTVVAGTYRVEAKSKVYRTPEVVSDWMTTFDYGLAVEPFEFELAEDG